MHAFLLRVPCMPAKIARTSVTVRLPTPMAKSLRILAAQRDTSAQKIIETAVGKIIAKAANKGRH